MKALPFLRFRFARLLGNESAGGSDESPVAAADDDDEEEEEEEEESVDVREDDDDDEEDLAEEPFALDMLSSSGAVNAGVVDWLGWASDTLEGLGEVDAGAG